MFFVKLIDSCMRYHVSLDDDDNDELLATVVDIATDAQFLQNFGAKFLPKIAFLPN